MRAIVRDTYGSPDVLELPHQALGFRVQAYGVTQQKATHIMPKYVGTSYESNSPRKPVSSIAPCKLRRLLSSIVKDKVNVMRP